MDRKWWSSRRDGQPVPVKRSETKTAPFQTTMSGHADESGKRVAVEFKTATELFANELLSRFLAKERNRALFLSITLMVLIGLHLVRPYECNENHVNDLTSFIFLEKSIVSSG